jgi:hypothetical protein
VDLVVVRLQLLPVVLPRAVRLQRKKRRKRRKRVCFLGPEQSYNNIVQQLIVLLHREGRIR